VANLEMMARGPSTIRASTTRKGFPVAARARMGDVRQAMDLISPKLADLHLYQLALPPPPPPAGSFDAAAAERGKALFTGKARCAECHVPPLFTEPGWPMHTAAELGIDDFQAQRSSDGRYGRPRCAACTRTPRGASTMTAASPP
jgi:hypothetical protein